MKATYYGFSRANQGEEPAWFCTKQAAERFNVACGGGLGEIETTENAAPEDIMDTPEKPWAKTELPTPEELAKSFSAHLLTDIGRDKLAQAVKLNHDEKDSRICHTHDFCDANCSMLDVLSVMGIEMNAQNDELNALWSAAWAIAKRDGFYL